MNIFLKFLVTLTILFHFSVLSVESEDENNEENIEDHYLRVASRFLDPNKDQYIENQLNSNADTVTDLFEKFKKKYDNNRRGHLCLDGLSARARIALLRKIIDYKVNKKTDLKSNEKWDYGKRSFKIWKNNTWTQSNSYFSYIDEIPTSFSIGDYEYVLEQESTNNNPGGGRLFGLKDQNKADSYADIGKFLQLYKGDLVNFFNRKLIEQKKDGLPIDFTLADIQGLPGNYRADNAVNDLKRFLNGLNLLYDFEVARRLVKDDGFLQYTTNGNEYALPIILGLSYLFNASNLVNSHEKIFIGKREDRMTFIAGTITGSLSQEQKDLNGQILRKTVLRESLKLFHNLDEDSGDEYSSD